MTSVGRSKTLPLPLLPLLYKVYNVECSITKLLNDDIILVLAHPVMASQLWESHKKTQCTFGGQYVTCRNLSCGRETHKSRSEIQTHIIYYSKGTRVVCK